MSETGAWPKTSGQALACLQVGLREGQDDDFADYRLAYAASSSGVF